MKIDLDNYTSDEIANCKVRLKDGKCCSIMTEEPSKTQDIWIVRVKKILKRSEKYKDGH